MRARHSGSPLTRIAALLEALGVCLLAAGAVAQTAQPLQVSVELPTVISASDHLDSTGTFAASATVKIVARVDGYLEKIGFDDGSKVEKGELLFQIERDTYEEQVKLYKAQYDRAETEYQRQLRLIDQSATSQTRVESWQAQRDGAAANLRLAQINLGYTEVRAPFAGLIGERLVDVGNFVGPSGGVTQLAEVQQIDPIYLNFSISAPDALGIRSQLIATDGQQKGATVKVAVGQSKDFKYAGTLDYVDHGIDQSSGTIRLRAVLDNHDALFLPGQFARVEIPLGAPSTRLTVPNRAVQRDQVGDYVLVVDDKSVIRQKRVRAGEQQGEARVILDGLSRDDRVVVKGLAYGRPGETVTVVTE